MNHKQQLNSFKAVMAWIGAFCIFMVLILLMGSCRTDINQGNYRVETVCSGDTVVTYHAIKGRYTNEGLERSVQNIPCEEVRLYKEGVLIHGKTPKAKGTNNDYNSSFYLVAEVIEDNKSTLVLVKDGDILAKAKWAGVLDENNSMFVYFQGTDSISAYERYETYYELYKFR
jgi:hypothetical protein